MKIMHPATTTCYRITQPPPAYASHARLLAPDATQQPMPLISDDCIRWMQLIRPSDGSDEGPLSFENNITTEVREEEPIRTRFIR